VHGRRSGQRLLKDSLEGRNPVLLEAADEGGMSGVGLASAEDGLEVVLHHARVGEGVSGLIADEAAQGGAETAELLVLLYKAAEGIAADWSAYWQVADH
jgi:hypothetical protein